MIVVCSQCSTRLQLDDAKIPSRAFTVRCPKCQSLIHGQPPASASSQQQSALGVGDSPALENTRFNPPMAAPVFKPENNARAEDAKTPGDASGTEPNDLAIMLAELLRRGMPAEEKLRSASRLKWEHRRALVCATPARREEIGRALVDANYQVYIAENTSQAIERMREEKMDVVVLETDFDPIEQGAAFVASEINALRPAERRRLIFVQLSPTVRTMDTHAAFVQNVNLVVNTADIARLPNALECTLRDFNDLYRDFNAALNIAAI